MQGVDFKFVNGAIALEKIDEFDGRASFLTWACTIARFEVLAARKRKFRDRLVTVDEPTLDRIGDVALDEASAAEWRLPLLRQCMEELPEMQREMIEDRYRPGGSIASIAKSLAVLRPAFASRSTEFDAACSNASKRNSLQEMRPNGL